jgi:DNA-binding transcriptional MerR regulator
MGARVQIGDFSKMTHLSIKALRHYHDVGLLVPVEVDPATGYRYYDVAQVPLAQVIRRFRDLGMPLDEIRAVLTAADLATRNEVILAHLSRMEHQLSQTQSMLASLRSLLEEKPAPIPVAHRRVAAVPAIAIAERVTMAELDQWWTDTFTELYGALRAAQVEPAGPGGALYPAELFQVEASDVVAFVPVPHAVPVTARSSLLDVPPAELAVAVHIGPFAELDRTYGALGSYVAERELGVQGPIREYYLVSPADTEDEAQLRTEVCWPIFQTTAR